MNSSCRRYCCHYTIILSYIILSASCFCSAFFASSHINYFIHQPYRQPHCNFALQSTPPSSTSKSIINDQSMWDPITQTYKDGIVPSHHSAIDIDELLALNNGKLKIFGYGSLCWHPGYDGVLSLASLQDDDNEGEGVGCDDGSSSASSPSNDESKGDKENRRRKVTTKAGRAIGYQRCWSQRSADHRGTTSFNGIVCTLLSDEEVDSLHRHNDNNDVDTSDKKSSKSRDHPSMTEGLIYTVDVDLVDDCLAELDFREKGVSIVYYFVWFATAKITTTFAHMMCLFLPATLLSIGICTRCYRCSRR